MNSKIENGRVVSIQRENKLSIQRRVERKERESSESIQLYVEIGLFSLKQRSQLGVLPHSIRIPSIDELNIFAVIAELLRGTLRLTLST